MLSAPPETMRSPSRLDATLITRSVCPVSGWPRGWPVSGPTPDRRVVTAGDDALAVRAERHSITGSVWPVSGAPMGCPVAASHTRTVRSQLPETMRVPSGLNATLFTQSVWPVSGGPIGRPVAASHTRTVLSALPETIRCAAPG